MLRFGDEKLPYAIHWFVDFQQKVVVTTEFRDGFHGTTMIGYELDIIAAVF